MYEQVRIEEKAHFYTKEKDIVDSYSREKEKAGYTVKVVPVEPLGYVVESSIWINFKKGERKDDYFKN